MVSKDRITIHMSTDIEKLASHYDVFAPWMDFVPNVETPKEKL